MKKTTLTIDDAENCINYIYRAFLRGLPEECLAVFPVYDICVNTYLLAKEKFDPNRGKWKNMLITYTIQQVRSIRSQWKKHQESILKRDRMVRGYGGGSGRGQLDEALCSTNYVMPKLYEDKQDTEQFLKNLFPTATPEERLAFKLAYYYDWKYHEVAVWLGWTRSQVVHRMLKLKKQAKQLHKSPNHFLFEQDNIVHTDNQEH